MSSNWELRVWTKESCPPIDLPIYNVQTRKVDKACAEWREGVIQRLITEQPNLVLISSEASPQTDEVYRHNMS